MSKSPTPAKSSKSASSRVRVRRTRGGSFGGMRRRARAGIVALALAIAALSSCGASGTRTDDQNRPAGRGLALKRIGNFAEPVYVTGAPGFPRLLFVVEREGRIQ